MVKMLKEETAALTQGKPGSGGIMTRTTHAYRHEFTAESDMKATKKGLSRDEVFGNLFVINFADHDATANTCVAVDFF